MTNPKYPGLIYGISKDEYDKIKDVEEFFIDELTNNTKFYFELRYNPKRSAVGLSYFENGKENGIVLYDSNLPSAAKGCHERIKRSLERKLDSIRIRKENWEK